MTASLIRWFLVAALAAAPLAQAQVYKWVDEKGATAYGSKPPPNARGVARLVDAEGKVSIIPAPRPLTAAAARERDAETRLARADRERDIPLLGAGQPAAIVGREVESRERCFAERRVDCTAPTSATYDHMPSFAPSPYPPLR